LEAAFEEGGCLCLVVVEQQFCEWSAEFDEWWIWVSVAIEGIELDAWCGVPFGGR